MVDQIFQKRPNVEITRPHKNMVFEVREQKLYIEYFEDVPGNLKPLLKAQLIIEEEQDMDYIASMFINPKVLDKNSWVSYRNDDELDLGVEWGLDNSKIVKFIDKTGPHKKLRGSIKISEIESVCIANYINRSSSFTLLMKWLVPVIEKICSDKGKNK